MTPRPKHFPKMTPKSNQPMLKKLFILTAMALATATSAVADNVPVVTVESLSGDSYSEAIAKVARVTLTDGNVSFIALADGSVIYSKPIAEISKVSFKQGTPTDLKFLQATEATVSIVAEPASRSVRIKGLADGSPVLVYSIAGALQLKGAAPSVSLSSLPAGLYIVVAGDAAAKVTVK